jgi:hypothetical protein
MRDFLNTIRTKWLLCGALFALIAVPSVIGFRYISLHRFDASRPHIPEVKEVADQIPIYPEFQRINDLTRLRG